METAVRLYSLNLPQSGRPRATINPRVQEKRQQPLRQGEGRSWCQLTMSFVLSELRVGATSRRASFSRDVKDYASFLNAGLDEDSSGSLLLYIGQLFEVKVEQSLM